MSDVEVEVEELFALFGVVDVIFSPFGDAWLFWAAHTTDIRRDIRRDRPGDSKEGRQKAVDDDNDDDDDDDDGDGPLLRPVYFPVSLRI